MAKIWTKIQRWWLFNLANPVIRKGELGGFKWRFRRYFMDISTLSGNFKARWTADEHPWAYLVSGEGEDNVHGFCEIIYTLSKTLTTEQEFVDDIIGAINRYEARLSAKEAEKDEDLDAETEEQLAIEEVKAVQEYAEMPKSERKKYERDVNGRFKKRVKESAVAQNLEEKK